MKKIKDKIHNIKSIMTTTYTADYLIVCACGLKFNDFEDYNIHLKEFDESYDKILNDLNKYVKANRFVAKNYAKGSDKKSQEYWDGYGHAFMNFENKIQLSLLRKEKNEKIF